MKYVDPVITERYARALYRSAEKLAQLEAVLTDIETLSPLLGMMSKLQLLLDSPQISTEAKRELIERGIAPRVSPVTARLLLLLVAKGRTEYAVAIFNRFKKITREAQGIFDAKVVSAVPLADGERARLQAVLEEHMRARLAISFLVDPRVVGGVCFQCGDLLLDDTVRGKLDRLRERLERVVTAK
jgi:F-type H+-transporting ATPase subunit delta